MFLVYFAHISKKGRGEKRERERAGGKGGGGVGWVNLSGKLNS